MREPTICLNLPLTDLNCADTVGYFPQMALSGLCAVTLLFLAAKKEMDGADIASRDVNSICEKP